MPICGRWRRASQEVLVRDVNEARQMPGLLDLWLDNPGFPQGGRDQRTVLRRSRGGSGVVGAVGRLSERTSLDQCAFLRVFSPPPAAFVGVAGPGLLRGHGDFTRLLGGQLPEEGPGVVDPLVAVVSGVEPGRGGHHLVGPAGQHRVFLERAPVRDIGCVELFLEVLVPVR